MYALVKMARFATPALMAAFLSCIGMASASERYVFEHEFVLGTSLQIQVKSDTPAVAHQVEANILAEIRRLECIFSSYLANSEWRTWQANPGQPATLSRELLDVLAACERWQTASAGAFNPAVQIAADLWKQAESSDRQPAPSELSSAVAAMQRPQWKLNLVEGTATRLTNGPLTLDAIAKGTILDRAANVAMKTSPDVHGVIINIGGDIRLRGDAVSEIQITDPFNDAINAAPLSRILVRNQGVATSGGYRRGYTVAGKRHSHLLDPRTALPVDRYASVTVVAPTAETADALATTFSVLSIMEIEAMARHLNGVDYLLIGNDGRQVPSPGWSQLQQPRLYRIGDATQQATERAEQKVSPFAAADKRALLELVVNFELASVTGAQYRRPYVAIWLEDSDGYPVKTALLWMMTKQPGPRWHRDLLRWYRNDRVRKLADRKELIGVISEATRGPGQYKAVFDGTDDAGDPLPPGKYTLFLEVAREHGTYQIIRHPLELGSQPIAEVKLKPNVEIKSASVEYRQPAATQKPDGN